MSNFQRLKRVPGMTPEEECKTLAALAQQVPGDQVIVEIGVFKGRTACYLAHGARHGEQPHVYGIDSWDIPGDRPATDEQRANYARLGYTELRTYREAQNNIRSQGMRAYVTLIRGWSEDVAAEWDEPRPIGLLFIDGNHKYEGVLADFQAWAPYLAEGARVVFDDYTERHSDVIRVVDKLIADGYVTLEAVDQNRLAVTIVGPKLPEATPPATPQPETVEPEEEAGEPQPEESEPQEAAQPDEELTEPKGEPENVPPPRSGAGSGAAEWRSYARFVTGRTTTEFNEMSRADIIALLEREGFPVA